MLKKVSLVFLLAVFLGSSQTLLFPSHASCKVTWSWTGYKCPMIQSRILDQIKAWNNTDCGNSEKCRYALLSCTESELKATHTTPKKEYVDDLSMKFETVGEGCTIEGFSTSETWYAFLDYGTNYCNLENLITGPRLNKLPGFTEKTSDSICTQHSSANCGKY